MTTDTVRQADRGLRSRSTAAAYTVGGMAKGSGMIAPNMATMLAVITTDAPLTSRGLRRRAALGRRRDLQPRHRRHGHVHQRHVRAAGDRRGRRRRDRRRTTPRFARGRGGGATRSCERARPHDRTRRRGRDQARHGHGAAAPRARPTPRRPRSRSRTRRWSRPRSSATTRTGAGWRWRVGKSGAAVDPDALRHRLRRHRGLPRTARRSPSTRTRRSRRSTQTRSTIDVDLDLGEARATVLTCDLTYEYVRINGEYRAAMNAPRTDWRVHDDDEGPARQGRDTHRGAALDQAHLGQDRRHQVRRRRDDRPRRCASRSRATSCS